MRLASYLLNYYSARDSLACLWYNVIVVQKTDSVIIPWPDEMYKYSAVHSSRYL